MIIFLIPSHTFSHLDTLILDWMLIGRPDLLKKKSVEPKQYPRAKPFEVVG